MRLQVQLERPAYAPGETVRAWARAIDGGDSRALQASLQYVERTDDYTEVPWQDAAQLWNGDLQSGQSFGFDLQLPADAKPGWQSEHGSLTWEVLVASDEFGPDSTASATLEVTAKRGRAPSPSHQPASIQPVWAKAVAGLGPAIGGGVGYSIAKVPGGVAGVGLMGGFSVLGWRRRAQHFALDPPAPVFRGESARANLKMLDPAKVKGEMEVELRCTEHYSYRSHSSKGGSHREVAEEVLHREVVALGAGRSAEIEVPAGQPFTHTGRAVSYLWTLVAREKRDNATDRLSEQPLLVLP